MPLQPMICICAWTKTRKLLEITMVVKTTLLEARRRHETNDSSALTDRLSRYKSRVPYRQTNLLYLRFSFTKSKESSTFRICVLFSWPIEATSIKRKFRSKMMKLMTRARFPNEWQSLVLKIQMPSILPRY